MSMEAYVFSDRRMDGIAQWQAALDASGYDIQLDASRAFANLSGFLPVTIEGKRSGFECDHFDAGQMIDELKEEGFPVERPWQHLLAFRFGGHRLGCTSALVAAAIYMRATEGVLFDCEEGAYYGPESALDYAQRASDPAAWDDLERLLKEIEAGSPILPT